MVNRNLIRSLENDPTLTATFEREIADMQQGDSALAISIESEVDFDVNTIVNGKILRVDEDSVLIDVGFKSEGRIPLSEWEPGEDPPQPGQMIKVLIEEVEETLGPMDDDGGMVALSKRKAEKILTWQQMMKTVKEGQVVTGTVTRKIKGGLLVDIGVNVFLPASQVDIRRPADIGDYIGRVVQCEVLKIDEARRNIVVSRRSLIEKQREEDREQLLAELEVGQLRKGVVKNIAASMVCYTSPI
jgi:small subunit ribosomal protein S1